MSKVAYHTSENDVKIYMEAASNGIQKGGKTYSQVRITLQWDFFSYSDILTCRYLELYSSIDKLYKVGRKLNKSNEIVNLLPIQFNQFAAEIMFAFFLESTVADAKGLNYFNKHIGVEPYREIQVSSVYCTNKITICVCPRLSSCLKYPG